jgi:NAD(P)-dependent dehydrogenase (short-subunit alcohol dehydrogenase family)
MSSGSSQIQNPSEEINPKDQGPKPTFHQKQIEYPGMEGEMSPKPDHGEETYAGLGRLRGKVALITGGDSGIGRAVAIAFAREGADLLIGYLPEEEDDASETARWVERAGRRIIKLPGDVRDEEYCKTMIGRVYQEFGKLDILVNDAGYQVTHQSIEEFSTEEIERSFRTNVYAMFWLCRAALPRMKAGSSIINVASIQSFDPSPALLVYAPTKAAIASFTKSLSRSAMKQGVRVNAVAPGPVWTPLIPSTMDREKVKKFGEDTVYERPAQPVEIAPVFVFLASSEARYVTGEVYGVTGGQTPY